LFADFTHLSLQGKEATMKNDWQLFEIKEVSTRKIIDDFKKVKLFYRN
jgi:hypothetical protein